MSNLLAVAGQLAVAVACAVLGVLVAQLVPSSLRRRTAVTSVVLLLAVTSVGYWMALPEDDVLDATIQSPANGSAVANAVPLAGSMTGNVPRGNSIWAFLQKVGEPNVHPLDHPCELAANGWSCDDLYVGQPTDAGQKFDISIYLANAEATAALTTYGERDKAEPGTYDGLDALPDEMTMLDRNRVSRR